MQSNLNSGNGTTVFYFLGIMLTGLAGAGLVMRMRRRDSMMKQLPERDLLKIHAFVRLFS